MNAKHAIKNHFQRVVISIPRYQRSRMQGAYHRALPDHRSGVYVARYT